MQRVRQILWSFLVLTASASASAGAAERVDLKRAVQMAAENAPAFDSLKRQLEVAALSEKNARSRLLPTLDLAATHGLQETSPRAGVQPWRSEFGLSLSETFYDNGVMWTQRRIARLERERAEAEFKDRRNKLSLEVASRFLQYSLNLKRLEIQEKQYQRIKRQYEIISRDFFQGIKTRKDYLRFKSEVNRADIGLLSVRNNVQNSRIELLQSMGVRNEAAFELTPVQLEVVPLDLPVRLPSLEEHLQYRSAEAQKEVAELNSDLVGRRRWPEWTLSAGVGYGSQNYLGAGTSLSDNASWNWNTLVKVTYNFLDWGIRSREAEIARHQKSITVNQVDTDLLSLQAELKQFEVSAARIQKTFLYAKELLELEKVNFDYIEREYRNGKVQYLDLITGLNGLASAQETFYSSATELATARFKALYHQGKLYDELVR